MGCNQSLLMKTPRRGWGGRKQREMTLVEKWTEFRDWVRRQRGKNRVVSISIKPNDKSRVINQQTLNVEQIGSVSSSDTDAIVVADETVEEIKVVETNISIENDNSRHKMPRPRAAKGKRTPHVPDPQSQTEKQKDTTNLSTEDGTVNKRIRPKAAKGPRTRPQEILPGVVAEDDDSVGECSVIKHKTTIDNDVPPSKSLFKRIRPKAAKGKRKVGLRDEKSGALEAQGSTQECLDAWMKRKLFEEGRE